MATKKAIIKAKIENIIYELMIKSNIENIFMDDGTTTLAAKLSEMIASLNAKATADALTTGLAGKADKAHTHAQSEVTGLETALSSRPTTTAMNTAISTAISELIGGAPETYDTLKEISDYISAHTEVVDALNAAIGNKVDKEEGKGLSANDFTDALKAAVEGMGALASKDTVSETDLDTALKEKVNAAAQGNHSHANKALLDTYTQTEADLADAVSKKHSHSNKSVLDGITSEKVLSWDGKTNVYVQEAQPADMKPNDVWIDITQ